MNIIDSYNKRQVNVNKHKHELSISYGPSNIVETDDTYRIVLDESYASAYPLNNVINVPSVAQYLESFNHKGTIEFDTIGSAEDFLNDIYALIFQYEKNPFSISGIDSEDLVAILSGLSHEIRVNTEMFGILLSNMKSIGCVSQYYNNASFDKLKRTKNNTDCFNTRKAFDLPGSSSCRECHIDCINKVYSKELSIK